MAPVVAGGEAMEQEQNAFIGPRNLINRVEYIRLIEQALHRLGLPDIARQLEQASGIDMQPRTATDFRGAVLAGHWDAALALLPQLASNGVDLKHAQFLLLRQKYVECVQRGDTAAALRCLRSELQPLQVNQKLLHRLAGLLMYPPAPQQDQEQQQAAALANGSAAPAGQSGSSSGGGGSRRGSGSGSAWLGGSSREEVLHELSAHLPPSLMIPDGRLEELVEQALLAQLDKCQFHNALHLRMSLFADYQAGLEQLPTVLSQVLENHTDEVWALQFSQDGKHLASASKDGSVILWSVSSSGEVNFLRYVCRGSSPMNIVSFSPAGDQLLVAGNDNIVRLFDVAAGSCKEYRHHKDAVTACCWFPDGKRFLTAGHDYAVYILSVDNGLIRTIAREQRLYDAAVSRDGSTVVTVGQDKKLHLLRLSDNREVSISEGSAAITCLSASMDGRYMLANLQSHVIHLWPLGDLAAPTPLSAFPASRPGGSDPLDALPLAPLQEYRVGESRPSRYVIRSTMGGAGNSFVASGSEDCKVYIWHRDSGDLLHVLEGHSATVNAVAWNPRNQYLLASASDDRTIRVWQAKAGMEYRQ